MQLSNLAIITVEKCDKVFSQITFIVFIQAPHDPTINTDILWVLRVLKTDKNIAGMHICMEETIAEHLRKEHLHASFGQQFHIGILRMQSR